MYQAMELHKLSVANLQVLSVYVGCDINGNEKKADFVARLTNHIVNFQHVSEQESSSSENPIPWVIAYFESLWNNYLSYAVWILNE